MFGALLHAVGCHHPRTRRVTVDPNDKAGLRVPIPGEGERYAEGSDDWFRLATSAGRVGVWDWNILTGAVTWSDVIYEIHGVEKGAFGGTVAEFAALVHPDDRPLVESAIRRAILSEQNYEVQFRAIRPDGEIVWIYTQAEVKRDDDGRAVRMHGATVDITERKQAEDALRRSEQRFRLMADAAPVLVWVSEAGRGRTWFNQSWLEFVGRSLEQELGEGWTDNLHPEDRERCLATYAAAFEDRRPFSVEFRLRRHDGEYRWLLDKGNPVADDEDEFRGYIGSCVDITERKQAERAMERRFRELQTIYRLSAAVARAGRLEDIYDAAMSGLIDAVSADRASVLLFDDDDVMRFQGWRGLSERYRQAVEGHSPWTPDDADATTITVPDVTADPAMAEYRQTFLDEGIRALSFIPLVSGARVVGKFMVYYDRPHTFSEEERQVCQTIADHVTYAIERARAERALRESSRRKDEFLALLGHELRNPLAPLRNMLEVMDTVDLDAELLARARRTMGRQVDHLVRLVDDLLDVSRISRGVITLRPERVELRALARDTAEGFLPVCREKQQELIVSEGEPVYLQADPTRVTQVLENLLSNASKFTDTGGRIAIEVERDGRSAVIRVRDTGIGIEPAQLPHIFDMFSRAGDPRKDPRFGGLGIGLSLVRSLVEMHGGTIEGRSDGAGLGSEFIVRLPIAEAVDVAASGQPKTSDSHNGARSRRVLVVDDNRDAADALSILLSQQGHEVHTVFDGLEAVEAAASLEPEVILLDLGLPQLSGVEAARRIRAQRGGADVLLVALTGWSQDEDRRRTDEVGFDAHLVKPLDMSELSRLLGEPKRR